MSTGGVDTGWTFYTPYSTQSPPNVIPAVIGIFIAGFSSILTGLISSSRSTRMRAPGMTWFRLPLFVWAHLRDQHHPGSGHAGAGHDAGPDRAGARLAHRHLRPGLGGDPLLFQHLFWFYSHPAVYIMILPGMGVVSEIIPCFSRKNIFGYHFIAFSSSASPCSASSSGAITCSSPGSRCTRA